MTNRYDSQVRGLVVKARESGQTLSEISQKFNISKSTASIWTAEVKITDKGQSRILRIQNTARLKAIETKRRAREGILKKIDKEAQFTFQKITLNLNLSKLLCAVFVWAEGEKYSQNRVALINSDPLMISTFLNLLRGSYDLQESKFRALVHIHEYHNESKVLKYWESITKIPRSQFTKSYLKKNTGKNKRSGYMGCIRVSYSDYKIARELYTLYNMFGKQNIGV